MIMITILGKLLALYGKMEDTGGDAYSINDSGFESDVSTESESTYERNCESKDYDYYAEEYIKFTDQNPTTYHVIDHFRQKLENKGFKYIPETNVLDPKIANELNEDGGLYYTVRSNLSLFAFVVGGQWKPESGIGLIGSHVDSLTAKLKPLSIKDDVDGYKLLGVAPYSGTLNKLWVDRDLGIGGSVLVKKDHKVTRKLVSSSPYPIARIPSLAPHFGDVVKGNYNKETEEVPVIGFSLEDEVPTEEERKSFLYGKHSIGLLRYISNLAQVPFSNILGIDLELFDTQRATRGGLSNEFIYAPRIDDRLCSFSAIEGLIEYADSSVDLKSYDGFNGVWLVDNEEIGSKTRTGARGKLFRTIIDKISYAKDFDDLDSLYTNSVLLSADMTHVLNPNFKNQYLDGHAPLPNYGLTVKIDPNSRYATDSVGFMLIDEIAKQNSLKVQQFHIRNDGVTGSTIGPIMATETGARVIDVGLSQLSMHSIRASCGYKEVGLGVKIFSAFFKDWKQNYDKITNALR